jgi:hypothetical protein
MTTLRDECIADMARNFSESGDAADWPDAMRMGALAFDVVIKRLSRHVGERAMAYDVEANAGGDGARKMQGAALAVLSNELLSAVGEG